MLEQNIKVSTDDQELAHSKRLQYNKGPSKHESNINPWPSRLQHLHCHYDHQGFSYLLTPKNWWSLQKGKTTQEDKHKQEG